jgi:hypothetical protein
VSVRSASRDWSGRRDADLPAGEGLTEEALGLLVWHTEDVFLTVRVDDAQQLVAQPPALGLDHGTITEGHDPGVLRRIRQPLGGVFAGDHLAEDQKRYEAHQDDLQEDAVRAEVQEPSRR